MDRPERCARLVGPCAGRALGGTETLPRSVRSRESSHLVRVDGLGAPRPVIGNRFIGQTLQNIQRPGKGCSPVFLRPDFRLDGLGQSVLFGLRKPGNLPKNFL